MPVSAPTARLLAALLAGTHVAVALGAQRAPGAPASPETPLTVARAAMRAVTADSVAAAGDRWRMAAIADPRAIAPRLALAVLARGTYDHAAARAWFDSAARVAGDDPRWRAGVAREASQAALLRGDFVQAHEAALRAVADSAALPRDEHAWSRFQELVTRRRRGGRVVAATLDSVAALASPADSLLAVRLMCTRLGADAARARTRVDSAVALALAAGDPQAAGTCLVQLGALLTDRGTPPVAYRAFMQADSLFVRARDPGGRAAANQRASYVLVQVGAVQEARQRLSLAITEATRAADAPVLAWAAMNVAQTDLLVGDRVGATAAVQRAIALHRQTGDVPGLATAEGFLAQLRLDLGEFDEAERYYRAQRAIFENQGDVPRVLHVLAAQANVAAQRGRRAESRALLDTLALRAGTEHAAAWRASLPLYRARLALMAGDGAVARQELLAARAVFDQRQALFRHEVDARLAWATLLTGDTLEAIRTLERADGELERFRATLSAGALRTVAGGRVGSWGGAADDTDRLLAALVPTRHLGAAFTIAERSRTRMVLDRVAGAETDSATLAAVRAAQSPTAITLAEAQARLPRSVALLVYTGGVGGAPTSLIVVTRDRTRGITLAPLRALEGLVVRWNALLEAGDAGTGAGTALARAILAPALAGLPRTVTRLVIVPQGVLHRVPFDALPVGRGVLGDRITTTLAPSATLALRALADSTAVPARVLAIGAGDAAQPDAAPGTLAAERGGATLAPLPAAADEARAATAWAPGSLALVGDQATEATLKGAATGPWTVLHAAAHALTTDQALGATWLIVRADAREDGYVSGGELAGLARGRTLVVLSGCRTTGDFGSRGDAVDGLVAPLLAAGVRTVVASHWAVSDASTRDLMTRFYAALARGTTVGDALATAQRDLRRGGASPRVWAAFAIIGDPSVRFVPARRG
jgi:tetratricopeptide (TPR) repeat protein